VAFHQDQSIPIRARVDHPDLSGWSMKEGELYVQPPRQVLEQLVAIRLHIDSCRESDGPLRVIPGSHRHGVLSDETAVRIKSSRPQTVCIANQGSVLIMRPLLLHASSKSHGQNRRRVLHFLFGPPDLPCDLQWPAAYH
jgi:ectoine hydroxylase-related dioxygenase (phytanoyl-CoA dioxygenase family)